MSSPSSFENLEKVSSNREKWATLSISQRLEILEEMEEIRKSISVEEWFKLSGSDGLSMMGLCSGTDVGDMEAAKLAFLFVLFYQLILGSYKELYEMRVKNTLPGVSSFKTRKAINGQICVETFPTFKASKSPVSVLVGCKGEVWLDPNVTKTEKDLKLYQYADNDDVEKKPGLMLVLGAGNHALLAILDIFYGLFKKNCVVYMKLHALRAYIEPLLRRLFQPLIKRGFLELEQHTTVERSNALVHHPLVAAVHLTGGKATHDAIAWGADPKEQMKNKENNNPVLKVPLTSELGAVSPWVVVPARYTTAELKSQAGLVASFIYENASCNCSAAKVVVISETWEQKDDFLKLVEDGLAEYTLPVPYYPGCSQRWQGFQEKYPSAKLIYDHSGEGIKERQLSKPLLSKEATLLPYLAIDLTVDLSTKEGRDAAEKEYAFKTEPFTPVYTVARLQNTSTLEGFCKTAATFCNDYLYGTLSGTVTVKPEIQQEAAVQQLIADLHYGSIGVNIWGGYCIMFVEGGWGAFPGESLNNVQSGIGRVYNALGIEGFQKTVLVGPLCSANYPMPLNPKKQSKIYQALTKCLLVPGLGSLVGLYSAVLGIDLMAVMVVGGATVAGIAGYLYSRRG